jgi:uncharacterized protein (TIGR02444 family)
MSTNEDLWTFSLRIYAGDGVASACLWLQDHRDADVNLLLYSCWLGSRGIPLDGRSIATARQAVAPWAQQTVRRLRTIRRWIKEQVLVDDRQGDRDYIALRESIKAAELEAERLQQRMLAKLPTPAIDSEARVYDAVQVITENSVRYLASLGAELDVALAERLAIVVAAASGSSRATAARAIASSRRTTTVNTDE